MTGIKIPGARTSYSKCSVKKVYIMENYGAWAIINSEISANDPPL